VLGNNAIDDHLASRGDQVSLVTEPQVATPGFLEDFDVLVYTRNGSSLGQTLSAAAAANVKAYARRAVLLNGDFADGVSGGDVETGDLVASSVRWAAITGRGYVGEFNGTFAAMTANGNALSPLDLISGSAAPWEASSANYNTMSATAPGTGHPALNGVTLPFDPAGVEIGAAITGADPANVLATWSTGNPAVLTRDIPPPPAPPASDPPVAPSVIQTEEPLAALTIARQRARTVRRRGLALSLTCRPACVVRGTLTLSRTAARKLGLKTKRAVVAGRVRHTAPAGAQSTFRIRLSNKVKRALARSTRGTSFKLTLVVTRPGLPAATLRRTVNVR
jgi:hypothetical protein